jgi:thymidylate synthase
MLLLEETELFRKQSLLLKIKNCSILNFLQTKGKLPILTEIKSKVKGTIEDLNRFIKGNSLNITKIR